MHTDRPRFISPGLIPLAATLALAVTAVALALPLTQEFLDDYRFATAATLGSREDLWRYALQMIEEMDFDSVLRQSLTPGNGSSESSASSGTTAAG